MAKYRYPAVEADSVNKSCRVGEDQQTSVGFEAHTSVFTRSQKVNDVRMMTQLTQDLEFPGKVSVVVLRGVFYGSDRERAIGRDIHSSHSNCVFIEFFSPFILLMAASILRPSFLMRAFSTCPKFPSPITSWNLMSLHSRVG